jgi:uncharacterized damage-inducible protein DinB
MRSTEHLLDQLDRAFGGDAWHGPALRKLIDGIDEPQAKQHPVAGAHSIFELVVHITTWIDVVARRAGGEIVEGASLKENFDPKTPWQHVVKELERAESRLCDSVARLSSDDLEKLVPGEPRKIESEILGILQHNVYHAGQIALLKRALGLRP